MDLPLPPDFREFLKLLNSESVEYLVVGGYAVAHHGYPRPTGDLDIWVAVHPDTAGQSHCPFSGQVVAKFCSVCWGCGTEHLLGFGECDCPALLSDSCDLAT